VGYDQVDWFFYVWRTSPPTSTFALNEYELVSKNWQNIDREWALNKFKENLPPNHTVASLELADQDMIDIPTITENIIFGVNLPNVWKMWYSQYMANELRLAYEKEHRISYDVVIRTRPDVALLDVVDVRIVVGHLKANPNLVMIPKNRLVGETMDRVICDLMGIANSESMNTYTNLVKHALDYHKLGEEFHPENLLACHLNHQRLMTTIANFSIEMRWLGDWQHIHTGEIVPVRKIQNLKDFRYVSRFGRWE
jgi:hypothetical protein